MSLLTQNEIMRLWPDDGVPLLSVCCVTYNHERYIRQAIDSFLMQETDFPFEVLINDDCSTDNTASVIREYETKYPDIIKVIYQKENQFSKGIKPNTNFNFPRVKGKYVALCEGDDFWTDPLKLKKQIDFLESNSDFSGSGHQVRIISSSEIRKGNLYSINKSQTLNKNDFLRDCPFQTSSFVFRSEIVKNNLCLVDALSGDKALMLLVSRFGLVEYFNQSMSGYRVHDGGISGRVTMKMMETDLNIIPWIMKVDPEFPKYRYASYLHETIMSFPVDKTPLFILKHFFIFIVYSFSYFPKNIPVLFRRVFRMSRALVKLIKSKASLVSNG